MQPPAGRNLPVKFVDPGFTAAGQHQKNARSYGSGWALLCCGMVSKSLLNLVLSFSVNALLLCFAYGNVAHHPIALVYNDLHPQWAHHPIALVYNNLHPQWEKSVNFFLHWGGLRSLALTYTHIMQLDTLNSYEDKWHFSSLTSLSLKLRGSVDTSQLFDDVPKDDRREVEQECWTHYLHCPRLQRLKLGRGMWVLRAGWADGFKALRCLTLKHVDWDYVDFKYLATLTPQLTEFTLYERWDLDNPSYGPRGGDNNRYSFDLSSARDIRFYLVQSSLTLFLTLSRSLKAFSAVAKWLVLSCKSTVPLYLHHLSLYGQERLVVSSLRLASARVAYLNGPCSDYHSRDDDYYSYWDSPELEGGRRVELPRSLGIVVENEERFEMNLEVERWRDDGEKEVTVEEFQERNQRQRILQQQQRQQQPWRQQEEQEEEEEEEEEQVGKPPLIRAPNLQAIFFPTRTCEQQTLAFLRESYPSLALYCIACRSFYWEKHGKELAETPFEANQEKQGKEMAETPVVHVRKGRSGVSSNSWGGEAAEECEGEDARCE
ncbi:unnamed protein product [Closterium sp. Naga37s-1]|nr:unnamed protein product [Closterium sp. Naga37s-1]